MKVHLIGVGGIGMSALAHLLLAGGAEVAGSDAGDSPMLRRIRREGGKVRVGHSAENLDHPDVVVYSSAISPENPELVAARNRGIPVLHRGQALAQMVAGRNTIAVAGAHGKSTTSALIGQLLVEAGRDPLLALGAEVDRLGGNARAGAGPDAVVEADESDGSFLWLAPTVAVLTNVDEEHLDYFRNRWEIEEAYAAFFERVGPRGVLVGCVDDPSVSRLLRQNWRRRLGYGLSEQADFRAAEVRLHEGGSRYRCLRSGRSLGEIQLRVPGLHNVVNSLAAAAVAETAGIRFPVVQKALRGYEGARRRFQVHGEARGVLVVEDYGHHPAEIEATLQAARGWKGRRIRCLFQPHRYSRTRYLMGRFASCFKQADEVILLPIYAASEEPMEGATPEALREALKAAGQKRVALCPDPAAALERLAAGSRRGDLVLFLGAGNVGNLATEFLHRLKR